MGQCGRHTPWVRKTSWRRKWQPTPEFFPGKSHGYRGLAAYSSWGCKESDTTEHTHRHTQTHTDTHTHILPPKVHFLISRTREWYGKRGFEDVIKCLEMDYLGEPEMITEFLLKKR